MRIKQNIERPDAIQLRDRTEQRAEQGKKRDITKAILNKFKRLSLFSTSSTLTAQSPACTLLPARISSTDTPSTFASSGSMEISGSPSPVSHLDTVRLLMPSISARADCVYPLLFLREQINLPISFASTLPPQPHHSKTRFSMQRIKRGKTPRIVEFGSCLLKINRLIQMLYR